ncbi:MAG: ABC transporter ATP-binding protein [Chloroflexi bacterium]|nr:ABC transporter ATP-binding protein [Chloroflexota bacterium]
MSAAISIRDVRKSFPEVGPVLGPLDLEIEPATFVSVLGPSGCGKSTLLRLIIGLDTDHAGEILFDGEARDASVSMAFQEPRLLPWRSVRANLQLVCETADREQTIDGLLELVGLHEFHDALPKQLSGGMAQRVSLARALVNEPEVMLLDEPFSALDAMTRMRLQDALVHIHQARPTTTLLVTHDIDEALVTSDRVVVLADRPGRVVEDIAIAVPRPRDRTDARLIELKARILRALGTVDGTAETTPAPSSASAEPAAA